MSIDALRERIEHLADAEVLDRNEALPVVEELLDALEAGRVRAAEPAEEGWCVHAWVKRGILLGFRVGRNVTQDAGHVFHFRDRDLFPARRLDGFPEDVRVVPGGTTIRRGAHVAEGVVVMPPAYVNVGAWIGPRSMIDSHALVGSCAQVGSDVHVSASAQIGGVLEPVGAMPVIVEDGAFVGGNCGVYEGVRVGRGAVLAPGVVLNGAVPLVDLVRGTIHRAGRGHALVVPEDAVVVPGSRPATGRFAEERGIQLQTPVIVKYRDGSTTAAVALEQALR